MILKYQGFSYTAHFLKIRMRRSIIYRIIHPYLDSSSYSIKRSRIPIHCSFHSSCISSESAENKGTNTPLLTPPSAPNAQEILEKSLLHKLHSDWAIRYTEFDKEGNVKNTDGVYKKSELCIKNGLLPRDLRKLDTHTHSIVPSILVRKECILVNLLHIRALIKADSILIFNTGGTNSHTQSVFMYDLQNKLRAHSKKPPAGSGMAGLPYEMRALEAIVISVVAVLDQECGVLKDSVTDLLEKLEEDIDRDKLRYLLNFSKKLVLLEKKSRLIRDCFDEILEHDDDLSEMYLTEKVEGKTRPLEMHDEIELLFESYLKQTDEIVQIVDNLLNNIKSTEEIVNIILDANRNQLMLLDLKLAILTAGFGSGALLAGLYGANVRNFFEESNLAFPALASATVGLSMFVMWFGFMKLKRTQRLTMYPENTRSRGLLSGFRRKRYDKLIAHVDKIQNPKLKEKFHDRLEEVSGIMRPLNDVYNTKDRKGS